MQNGKLLGDLALVKRWGTTAICGPAHSGRTSGAAAGQLWHGTGASLARHLDTRPGATWVHSSVVTRSGVQVLPDDGGCSDHDDDDDGDDDDGDEM